ncbi:MAG: type II secretion system protein GspK [Pirellulales bacterium]|nr:type II secretion system protein GspK [Pirellulales bacterium]
MPMYGNKKRRGGILIIVLVVVVMLSLGALTFSQLSFTELRATQISQRQGQARALTDSGVELLKRLLVQESTALLEAGGLYDNPDLFQNRIVLPGETAANQGAFSIVSQSIENGEVAGLRYGLEDESTKLNINILAFADQQQPGAGQSLLMTLPGMTEDLADKILDYLDEDDSPRELGAESDVYSALDPPYSCKNAPLETIDELLLVQGVTPELLYGADTNRNGLIDESEAANPRISDTAEAPAEADRGWAAYLTLYSLEGNLQPDKTPKIDLNSDDLQTLYDDISTAFNTTYATYVIAYRQNGPYTGSRAGSQQSNAPLDMKKPSKVKFTSILDLIGSKVQISNEMQAASGRGGNSDSGVVLESPFPNEPGLLSAALPDFLDKVTTNSAATIPGRVNINQASEMILKGIPGMSQEIVERILSRRTVDPASMNPAQRHETWLLSEGLVTLDEMKTMMPFVCAQGSAHRAQIIGFFGDEGPAARVEAIIDTSSGLPQLVFWKDMSHLGRGFSLTDLGAAAP